MALLYDETANVAISKYAQFENDDSINEIVSRAIDGTRYIQIIGSAATDYDGTVYVDRAGKALLETAYTNGNLLRVEVKRGIYRGRIIKLKFGPRQARDTFQATVTLAKEVTT